MIAAGNAPAADYAGRVILVVDHRDSFTYNLVQLIERLGHPTEVVATDAEPAEALAARRPDAVVLSPGPGSPAGAAVFLDLLAALPAATPVLGVCLGHQALGQHFGARVDHAPQLMHGRTSELTHEGRSVFAGAPSPMTATRYHSLTIAPDTVPASLVVNGRTSSGVVMAAHHATLPLHGVQFHPESFMTQVGKDLLKNFLNEIPLNPPLRKGGELLPLRKGEQEGFK